MFPLVLLALGIGALVLVTRSSSAQGRVAATAAITGPEASVTAPRGTLVLLQTPLGGSIASFAPSQNMVDMAVASGLKFMGGPIAVTPGAVAVVSVPTLLPAGTYDFNIFWRGPSGSPLTTVLHVNAT